MTMHCPLAKGYGDSRRTTKPVPAPNVDQIARRKGLSRFSLQQQATRTATETPPSPAAPVCTPAIRLWRCELHPTLSLSLSPLSRRDLSDALFSTWNREARMRWQNHATSRDVPVQHRSLWPLHLDKVRWAEKEVKRFGWRGGVSLEPVFCIISKY
jgi:hypothetical protein